MKLSILVTSLAVSAALATSAVAEEEKSPWGGTIAGGLHVATGNTQSEDLNLDGKLTYRKEKWRNRLRAQAFNKKENEVRTDEEYRVNFKSRYDLSERDDVFAELEYIDDRFSGYDYRISEVVGYGRSWQEDDTFTWRSSVAAGFQHNRTTDGEEENSPLGRAQNDITWVINEHVDFSNTLRVDMSDVNVYFTETAIKTALTEALYLRLSFQTETLSEVPTGRKKTDTDTLVNIGYEF